jgi:hypothetical protein
VASEFLTSAFETQLRRMVRLDDFVSKWFGGHLVRIGRNAAISGASDAQARVLGADQ